MSLYFNADVSVARMRGILGAVLLMGGLVPNGWAGEPKAHDGTKQTASDKKISALEDRKEAAETLKANLEKAKTPEEKRALVKAYQAENEVLRQPREIPQGEKKSPRERWAEMKAKTGNDPAMLARLAEMEARLASVELIEGKLAKAQAAEGEEKSKLMAEVRSEQHKMAEAQRAAMTARMREAKTRSESPAHNLTPEMAAQSEARRAELDQLREAMKTAPPQERAKLLEDWRQKREEEMAAMRG